MKRFLIATALTASLSTAAYAATEAEIAQIQSLMPNVDAAALSDTEVSSAMSIITSSESRSNKMSQLSSILDQDMPMGMAAMPTEAQSAEIESYAPGVDYTTVTQAQLDTAMNYINSGMGESDIAISVQSVLSSDTAPVGDINTASTAEVAILQRYLPDMEVASLTESELNLALATVYGGGSESEIQDKLAAMVN
jgi:uncharacterized protein YqeY